MTSSPARPASSTLSRPARPRRRRRRRRRPRRPARPARRPRPPRSPGRTVSQRGDRAEHARPGPAPSERPRRRRGRQAERQRLVAGLPGGALPLGGALGVGQLGHAPRGGGVRGDRVLVRGVQGDVAVLLLGRRRAPVGQLLGRPLGARRRPRPRRSGQPVDLVLRRRWPASAAALTWPVSLARPSRRSASAWAAATSARSASASAASSSAARGDGLGQPGALGRRARPRARPPAPRPARPRRPAARGRGPAALLAAARRQVPGRSAASDAVPRNRSFERGQPVPGVLRPRRARGALAATAGSSSASRREPRRARPRRAARRSRTAVSSATSLSRASRSATRSSASSRSRASRRSAWTPAARRATSACRPSGLSWRRSSAVRSVSRLRLACIAVELAQRLLLALAVLEDAGGLLDEGAAVLRAAVSTASSWPWPTMTCISRPMPESLQQLLDVEQPAPVAVDLVLALAGAEHPAGDRDLGVVDRAARRRRCRW